jgi:aminoglycoside phosphotransferase (APT) family kinase protein
MTNSIYDGQIELYRGAIGDSFPELAGQALEYFASGKDYVVCLLEGGYLFRFPKRAEAERKLRMEIKLLPELGRTLPLPTPEFSYVASARVSAFSHAFVGYRILAGEPLTNYVPDIWDAGWWPPSVGEFLTALHRFPVKRAQELGVPGGTSDEWRNRYQKLYRCVQEYVYPIVTTSQRTQIATYFEDYLNDPRHFRFKSVLLHGDFYSQHILLNVLQQRVTGIIDFSECVIGDPAFDIRNAWEPYYVGEDISTDSWKERREFYYRLQPLLDLVLADGTAGMEDVNPHVRSEALLHLDETWPPDGAGHYI